MWENNKFQNKTSLSERVLLDDLKYKQWRCLKQKQARKEEYKRITKVCRDKIRKVKTLKLKIASLYWARRTNCKGEIWGCWCIRDNTVWVIWKNLKYSGPFPPFLSQPEPSPWFLQVSEQFKKEPVLCEQARNCFIWTYSYSWEWPKGAGKVGCCSCLLGCCDSKTTVYYLWKIMMNGKSKQYSHVQEWQKIGSGMQSAAGLPQSLQRLWCMILSWNSFLNSNRTRR